MYQIICNWLHIVSEAIPLPHGFYSQDVTDYSLPSISSLALTSPPVVHFIIQTIFFSFPLIKLCFTNNFYYVYQFLNNSKNFIDAAVMYTHFSTFVCLNSYHFTLVPFFPLSFFLLSMFSLLIPILFNIVFIHAFTCTFISFV